MGPATLQGAVPEDAWRAIVGRDREADGRFVFAVHTTGIFCRPSCPARRPGRDNVAIFRVPEEARSAGFRACLRCSPMGPSDGAKLVNEAIRLVAGEATIPTTSIAAKRLRVSTSTLQRAFRSQTGLSLAQFMRAQRLERGRTQVAKGATVRAAARSVRLSSPSKLYDSGVHPSALRASGQTIRYVVTSTSLGPLLVAATAKGLCVVRFGDDPTSMLADLRRQFPTSALSPADDDLQGHVKEILARIAGRPPRRDLPLDVQATAFRLRVWKELANIPRGATVPYSELARRLGAPDAVRAVASACASNELAVVIPCHRVVGKDGSLTGYRWGLERKAKLLAQEAKEPDV